MTTNAPRGRVIAIEGLDGAGKSTVIAVLAKRFRQAGHEVVLPRPGKHHTSRPARAIRDLARDRQNLELCPRAELALYCAREAQVLAQDVAPAVARGATVILDRSLLTPVVLGAYGRGLPRHECEAMAAAAAGGLHPDVTVILDVDPRTSRLRKRLGKIGSTEVTDPSRKGLAGTNLKIRVRDGYRDLARERGYPLFHTERVDPKELGRRVFTALSTGADPSEFESPDDGIPQWQVGEETDFETALASVPESLALYMTRGLIAGRARRQAALATLPKLVAWALDPMDPLSQQLAFELPALTFRGWGRRPLTEDDPRVATADRAPAAVAAALRHLDDAIANRLRLQLVEHVPGAVVASLSGAEDDFSWSLRRRAWSHATLSQAATSLVGCRSAEAWTLRRALFECDPAGALKSLAGLDDAEARTLMERYAALAPKPALRAITGDGSAFAHALREQLADAGREVIESLGMLADEPSMRMREASAEQWPDVVARSLRAVEDSSRVTALLDQCRHAGLGDLHVLRQFVARAEYPLNPEWSRKGSDDDATAA